MTRSPDGKMKAELLDGHRTQTTTLRPVHPFYRSFYRLSGFFRPPILKSGVFRPLFVIAAPSTLYE